MFQKLLHSCCSYFSDVAGASARGRISQLNIRTTRFVIASLWPGIVGPGYPLCGNRLPGGVRHAFSAQIKHKRAEKGAVLKILSKETV